MFHWICPECGREIPPAIKECSTCDPHAAPVPAPVPTPVLTAANSLAATAAAPAPALHPLDPLLGLAQKLRDAQREFQGMQRETPSALREIHPPPREVQAEEYAGSVAVETGGVAVENEVEVEVESDPEPLAVTAELPPSIETAPIPAECAPASEDSGGSAPPEAETAAAESTIAAPAVVASSVVASSVVASSVVASSVVASSVVASSVVASSVVASSVVASSVVEASVVEARIDEASVVEPGVLEPSLVEPSVFEPSVVEPSPAEPDHAPTFAALFSLPQAPLLVAPAPSPAGLLAPIETPVPVEPHMEFPEWAQLSLLSQLCGGAVEQPPAAPEPPAPSQAGRVPTPDPDLSPVAPVQQPLEPPQALPVPAGVAPSIEPDSELAPPALVFAPLQDSSSIANRIRAASPAIVIARTEVAPRVSLPGPALPKALNSLEDAGLSKILVEAPAHARSSGRAWITGGLAAVALLGALLGMELYNAPHSAASGTPAPVRPAVASVSVPAPPAAQTPVPSTVFSLAKAVEVTGLRITDNEKPEVRYIVVNHSGTALSAVTVYVTVRSSSAKVPLYHFSFRAPALAPYASKEMNSSIDKPLPPGVDWQNVHADVELGQ